MPPLFGLSEKNNAFHLENKTKKYILHFQIISDSYCSNSGKIEHLLCISLGIPTQYYLLIETNMLYSPNTFSSMILLHESEKKSVPLTNHTTCLKTETSKFK